MGNSSFRNLKMVLYLTVIGKNANMTKYRVPMIEVTQLSSLESGVSIIIKYLSFHLHSHQSTFLELE